MNQTTSLFADFSQELLHKGMAPLSEDQYTLLLQRHGPDWIDEKIAAMRQGDEKATEAVRKWSTVAKLTAGLNLLQIPIDLNGATEILRNHDSERVMSLVSNARKSQDPSHRNELRRMVNGSLDNLETGAGQAPPPRMPSPQDRVPPVAPQSRRLGQMPPPPGTQTSRAYPRGVDGPDEHRGPAPTQRYPERTPAREEAPAPRDRSNVHQIDQGRRYQRPPAPDDLEPADGYMDDAIDDRGGEGQRTYDSASAFNRGNNGCAVRFQNAQDTRKADRVRHVVFVESAPINKQTRTTYHWERKITLMLNEHETEQAVMVMYGMLPSVRFTAHGKDKKGWMQIAQQDPNSQYAGCVQVQLGRGEGTLTTNIYPTQLSKIKTVVLRAYVQMMGFDSMDAALRHLHMSASSYAIYAEMNPPRETPRRQAYGNRG